MDISSFVRRVIAAVFTLLTVLSVSAHRSDTIAGMPLFESRVGVELRSGWVPPTNSYIRGENQSCKTIDATSAVHLRYDVSFTGATRYGRLYPGAYQGIGVAMNTFYRKELLGTPVAVYVFQGAPIVHFSDRLWLGYEWNFGASFGWKKYDERENGQNKVIGSSVNAFIDVALLLNYRLSSRWQMWAGVEGAHYSNGNTSWPNAGVNSIGVRIGISYRFGTDDSDRTYVCRPSDDELSRYDVPDWSYDVMAYGATRKRAVWCGGEPSLAPGNFGVAGLQVAPMYRFCRYFRAGVSADIQYDESSGLGPYWVEGTYDENIKFRRPEFFRQISAGLSARAEMTMPIFSVNVGFGRNLLGPADSRKFYQLLALKTFVSEHLFLYTGYQLSNFKDPNNLMLGIGYRFN